MNELRAKLLEIAYCELGNEDPSAYWLEAYGHLPDKPRAWCAVFYLACLLRLELCDWRWPLYFSGRLPLIQVPEPGDLAYFDKPFQHHAMVQSLEGATINLIQGNYGTPGRVAESQFIVGSKPVVYYSIAKLIEAKEVEINI